MTSAGRVRGIAVGETQGRVSAELRAPVVINAAGPWAGPLAAKWGGTDDRLAPLVVAWNVLLDRPALSGHAVALQDPSAAGAALKFGDVARRPVARRDRPRARNLLSRASPRGLFTVSGTKFTTARSAARLGWRQAAWAMNRSGHEPRAGVA